MRRDSNPLHPRIAKKKGKTRITSDIAKVAIQFNCIFKSSFNMINRNGGTDKVYDVGMGILVLKESNGSCRQGRTISC